MSTHYKDNVPSLLKQQLYNIKMRNQQSTQNLTCVSTTVNSAATHCNITIIIPSHHNCGSRATKFCSNTFPCIVPLFRFVYTTVCCMIQLASGTRLYYHMCTYLCSLHDDSSQFLHFINGNKFLLVGLHAKTTRLTSILETL